MSFVGMTASYHLVAETLVVVDLTVKYDPNGPVFVGDGLMTCTQVNDAEAAHSDTDLALNVDTSIVGPPMCHNIAHPSKVTSIDAVVLIEIYDTGDSAHDLFSSFSTLHSVDSEVVGNYLRSDVTLLVAKYLIDERAATNDRQPTTEFQTERGLPNRGRKESGTYRSATR
jgi:hypothetical protein